MPIVPSTDGVRLAVHDLGGDGPPLLLSHATGFHAMVWEPMAAHLRHRFRCWAVDYRGHGDSTSPGEAVHWRGYGDDARAVVRDLALQGCLAVGHSMGGAALLMAEIAEPGTFAGIVAYEPIVFPPVDESAPPAGPGLAEGARRRRAVFGSKDAAYENFAAKPPLDVFRPEALRAYVDHGFAATDDGQVRLKCHPEHEARTYEMGPRHDTFVHLGQVGCPVLVLAGNPEGNPPGVIAPHVAEQLPHARFVLLSELGHFGPMQDPHRVAALVEAFADEIGA